MQKVMTSKERLLTAINHQEPDRVPILFGGIAPLQHLWKNEFERVDALLKLGVDDKLAIAPGSSIHPDVTTRFWVDEKNDPQYPLVCQEWHTPKGILRAVMRRSQHPDGQYLAGVPLACNANVSHGVEMPIKGRDDLPKLAYLIQEPNKESVAKFRARHKQLKKFASEKGILLEGGPGPGQNLDMAYQLCGNNLFYLAADDHEFVEELLNILHRVSLKNLEMILDIGVDSIIDTGYYQTAPLWSPQIFDKFFAPRLKQKVDLAHQAGAKYFFYDTGHYVPHLDTLLQIGVDVLAHIRPFPGGLNDMHLLKQRVGHRICLQGGVNPEEDIERATGNKTRRAVIDVILAAAQGGGFILSTGGSIFINTECYENVMTFINTCREFGDYPINISALQEEKKRLDSKNGSSMR